MLVEPSSPSHTDDPRQVFEELKKSPLPVFLVDHHNTTNNILEYIAPIVQEDYLHDYGRILPLWAITKWPLYEHILQTVTEIERRIIKHYQVDGKPIDQAIEPSWEGAGGLKLARVMGFQTVLVTGALGNESQAAVQDFYLDHNLRPYLTAVLGRTRDEDVYKFKGRINVFLKGTLGVDDQLKVLYYGYAINGTDALWINPSLKPEDGEGRKNLCDHIGNTRYAKVVKRVLGPAIVNDPIFKTRVFGPYADIGQAMLDRVIPNFKYYLEQGKINQQKRINMTEVEIAEHLVPIK